MNVQQRVLSEPFNIETHKKTFINYLEVIILKDGTVVYAIPSHQEKLIEIACRDLKINREELYRICPKEYYFDVMTWLCQITNCIALWNERMEGKANRQQEPVVRRLIEEGLYQGKLQL